MNAVYIQVYTVIIAYCLVAIIEHDLKLNRNVGEVMRILGSFMLAKDDIKDLFAPKQEAKIDDGGWPMFDFMYN